MSKDKTFTCGSFAFFTRFQILGYWNVQDSLILYYNPLYQYFGHLQACVSIIKRVLFASNQEMEKYLLLIYFLNWHVSAAVGSYQRILLFFSSTFLFPACHNIQNNTIHNCTGE